MGNVEKINMIRIWMIVICLITITMITGYAGLNPYSGKAVQGGDDAVTSYEGFGSQPYNIMNGNSIVELSGKYVFNAFFCVDNEGGGVSLPVKFDYDANCLEMFCDKKGCIHADGECINEKNLLYMNAYGNELYVIDRDARNEIRMIKNGELSSVFKADSDIYGLWGYNTYLYYCTDEGLFRTPVPEFDKTEKIIDEPVADFFLNFDEDKMYWIDELYNLYSANHDGSEVKLLVDRLVSAPQLYGDRIYFKSRWLDEGGKDVHNVYSIRKDGSDFRLEIKGDIWRYSICDDGIYYAPAPSEELYFFPDESEELRYSKYYCGTTTTLYFMDFSSGETKEIVKGISPTYMICEDKIIIEKCGEDYALEYIRKYPDSNNVIGYAYYSIAKDGSNCTRLDCPDGIKLR